MATEINSENVGSDVLMPQKQKRQRGEQQRAQEKIELVIAATIEILEKDGQEGVNLKEIASATGVSYGAIYHHFGDRGGLIQAAQFERLRRQPGFDLESFGAALDSKGDVVDFVGRIQKIADDIADPSRASVRFARASVIVSSVSRPELRDALIELEDGVFRELRELVKEAQRRGLADPTLDPGATAAYIEALSFGLLLMEFVEEKPSPAAISNLLFRGFAALLAPSSGN